MPTFSYRAKDRSGNTVTGSIEALDVRQAAGMIREQGGLPMEIRPVDAAAAPSVAPAGSALARYLIHPLWTGVNIRALMFFFRQMATLLAAGMSLSEALRSVGTRQRGRLGRIVADMNYRVMNGGRLSQEMERHPRVFSKLQLSLTRVGESGGLIDQMMDRIASHLEYEMSVRRRIVQAVFYPCMIFAFIILKPILMALILENGRAALMVARAALQHTILPLLCIVIVVKLLLQFEAARYVWDYLKMLPPMLGTAAKKVAMSRFSRALAVLYASGLPLTEALMVAADASANVAVAKGVRRAVPAIQAGEGLTASLQRTGVVSPMVLDMLATGERTGNMDGVLQKVSGYMDEEVDMTVHKTGIVLFVMMIIVAGIVVAVQLLGFYGGYFNQLLSGAGG